MILESYDPYDTDSDRANGLWRDIFPAFSKYRLGPWTLHYGDNDIDGQLRQPEYLHDMVKSDTLKITSIVLYNRLQWSTPLTA